MLDSFSAVCGNGLTGKTKGVKTCAGGCYTDIPPGLRLLDTRATNTPYPRVTDESHAADQQVSLGSDRFSGFTSQLGSVPEFLKPGLPCSYLHDQPAS